MPDPPHDKKRLAKTQTFPMLSPTSFKCRTTVPYRPLTRLTSPRSLAIFLGGRP